MNIKVPYAGCQEFHINRLIKHISQSGRSFIIQGQQTESYNNHSKKLSLDHWLRTIFPTHKDTKLADNDVIDQLTKTGLFTSGNFLCPESNRLCFGIQLKAWD